MPDNRDKPFDPPTPRADDNFEACVRRGHEIYAPAEWPIPAPAANETGRIPTRRIRCNHCGAMVVLEWGKHSPKKPPRGVTILKRPPEMPAEALVEQDAE